MNTTANPWISSPPSPDRDSRFLHELLVMGELMQSCGAEVYRVEDTLNRMGQAYGVGRMNVFVITSSIIITMEFPDGREVTQTRRIREAGGNDFTKLEKREVELGRNNDEYIEVLSGLTEGETVFIPNAASSFMNAMMGM